MASTRTETGIILEVDVTPEDLYRAIDDAYGELEHHATVCTAGDDDTVHQNTPLDKSLQVVGKVLYELEGLIDA